MPFKIDTIETDNLSVNGTQITENGGSPYKVYTALLTQNGTDTESTINSGSLTIGVTYTVNQNSPGMDFTNVGAPNNNIGTKFVATGTIPNSWGEGATYTLAYSEGAPVATVLENTIGNIWFTYIAQGVYSVNSVELFTQNKIWATAYSGSDDETIFVGFVCGNNGTSEIRLNASNGSNGHISIRLEIRVYN